MEGADQPPAVYRAVAQVGAEVGAGGVEEVVLARGVAPEGQVLAEAANRPDLARGEIARPADLEPAARDRQGEARGAHACAAATACAISSSSGTIFRAAACVLSSFTGQALPAR